MARDFRTRLAKRASKSGVFLDEALASGLVVYYELLARWNRKINLTSLEDPDEAIDRLLLEPVVAARHLSPAVVDVMDIGSGGGSPALPLALALGPQVRLTMVEVKARKSAFLREAVRHLGLTDARVETSRYEELLALPELHEKFDVLSMRAVKVESRVLMTLQAFVKPGGSLLLFRGPTGPEIPPGILHPLEWQSTVPLVEALQSRLSILRKRSAGSSSVPRGTTAPARLR
ncbi:MAG: 16S rRNA (guanine(527)-N(7))-methyltransferase RsmG [Vicinamibacterales bacterium]